MRIFHIATGADWAVAQRAGTYTTSTLGRSLAEEGFIHASRREQVGPTFARFYRGVREPLVLLTIETDRLEVDWREDPVGDDTYPHLYGPLNTDAVVRVQPLSRRGGTESLTSLFAREMGVRMGLAIGAMLLAFAGSALADRASEAAWAGFAGALAGLALGVALYVVVVGRRA